MGIRVVVRVYEDRFKKPHLDEFKRDVLDEDQLGPVSEDIHEFISQLYYEHEEEGEEDVSSDEPAVLPVVD